MQRKIERHQRPTLWRLKLQNIDTRELTGSNKISDQMLKLIDLDVKRTNYNEGIEYQKLMSKIIKTFLMGSEQPAEYFQGFNYIVSFSYGVLQNAEHVMQMIVFLQRNMMKVR